MNVDTNLGGSAYKALARKSGIYKISHTPSGKRYIGSTADLYRRLTQHRARLRAGIHPNNPLQNAYNKYGEGEFLFTVLAWVGPDDLLSEEQAWLDRTSKEKCYNILNEAGSCRGFTLSAATKRKISEKMKGNRNAVCSGGRKTPPSTEDRAKISFSKRRSPYPQVKSPSGDLMQVRPSLSAFCTEHELTRQGMQLLFSGQRKHHKGWTLA